jgi:acetyl esterase/lipase
MTVKDALRLPTPPPDHRIPYDDDSQQFGDLRLPKGKGPHPVVIVVHGGCFRAKYDLTLLSSFSAALTEAGLATWSLEYRRVGNDGGGWPGTFEDVARGADHLRVVARSYPLDLNRVVATGHSAGGHLVGWLAARPRLPKESVLYSDDPLPLRGVVPLAGVMDLRRDLDGGICAKVTGRLMGGTPAEVPDRYQQGSPIELLPFGLPQRSIIGDKDQTKLVEMVRHYTEAAKDAGDDATLAVLEGAGHFELTTPGSSAWPVVRDAVRSLLPSEGTAK